MKAKILEVCVGKPRDMIVNGQTERSGIHKSPITGSVALGLAKLAGDGQANLKYHGGRKKPSMFTLPTTIRIGSAYWAKTHLNPPNLGRISPLMVFLTKRCISVIAFASGLR